MGLDLNRGVKTKFHPSGIKVNMYLDDPGTYLDDRGERMPIEIAAQAGFNVERHKKEKIKQLQIKAYKEQLDRELATEEEALADAMSHTEKYDVRHVGAGLYAIFDKISGEKITRAPMSKADVEALIGPLSNMAAGEEHDPSSEPSSEAPEQQALSSLPQTDPPQAPAEQTDYVSQAQPSWPLGGLAPGGQPDLPDPAAD